MSSRLMTEQTHPLSPHQGTRVKAYSITHDSDRPTPEPTRVPNYNHKHKTLGHVSYNKHWHCLNFMGEAWLVSRLELCVMRWALPQ